MKEAYNSTGCQFQSNFSMPVLNLVHPFYIPDENQNTIQQGPKKERGREGKPGDRWLLKWREERESRAEIMGRWVPLRYVHNPSLHPSLHSYQTGTRTVVASAPKKKKMLCFLVSVSFFRLRWTVAHKYFGSTTFYLLLIWGVINGLREYIFGNINKTFPVLLIFNVKNVFILKNYS